MVQVEHLVSHGFIVVGMDHPHSSELVVFPDGRVVHGDPDQGEDYSSEPKFRTFLRTGERRLPSRVDDVHLVLDSLEEWNYRDPEGILTGRMDLTRVGIFGHSFGGAVAAESCRSDVRLRAGVDLDGLLFGQSAKLGVDRPFMFFTEDLDSSPANLSIPDSPAGRKNEVAQMHRASIRRTLELAEGYSLVVRGTSHKNYCDSPLFSPFRDLTGAGPIDPRRAFQIVNVYLLSFFRHVLLGAPEPLLRGPSAAYPEVTIEIGTRAGSREKLPRMNSVL